MNIIYIDDDSSNRSVLREMLALAGVKMLGASNAQTGLQMIEENDFSIVLMDLRMPGTSGLTAIRQLRARRDSKGNLPILVVTADLTSGTRSMCECAGADDFIVKPVAAEQLFSSIGRALGRRADAVLA